MRVFSSMRVHDINPAGVTSEGPRLLREFLSFAEHRLLSSPATSAAAGTESPFERDVCRELTKLGIRVQPQVGASAIVSTSGCWTMSCRAGSSAASSATACRIIRWKPSGIATG